MVVCENLQLPAATTGWLTKGRTSIYRIPTNLDLSWAIGEFTTQVRVGQFDLQFTFGSVDFAVQSPVSLFRDDMLVGQWIEGRWPDAGFFDIMNTPVCRCDVVDDRTIVLEFENGLTMHLTDDSDAYECMQIRINGALWVI